MSDVQRIPVTDRESWLALRQQDVTASDIAAIWGASPHKSMLALWAEKSGTDLRKDETAFTKRGRHLEPAILSAAAECDEFAGAVLRPAGFYLRSPSLRMGATPDAIVRWPDGDGIEEPVDAKSVASWIFDTQWDGGPPLHIQLQVLVQAMLLGAPRGWVACAVMNPDFPIHIYEIPRNAVAEQKILEGVKLFWETVADKEMPPPKAGDHATLSAMFPRVERTAPLDWENDAEATKLLGELDLLTGEVKPREKRIDEIQAILKAKVGSAESAIAPGWLVTWKEQTRKAFTVAESTFRVLRVKTYTALGAEKAA